MEVSTQVNQLFEATQVDSSNLSSSIQRLVANAFQFLDAQGWTTVDTPPELRDKR
jgi:hypothetical protein